MYVCVRKMFVCTHILTCTLILIKGNVYVCQNCWIINENSSPSHTVLIKPTINYFHFRQINLATWFLAATSNAIKWSWPSLKSRFICFSCVSTRKHLVIRLCLCMNSEHSFSTLLIFMLDKKKRSVRIYLRQLQLKSSIGLYGNIFHMCVPKDVCSTPSLFRLCVMLKFHVFLKMHGRALTSHNNQSLLSINGAVIILVYT